jgi:hypothetical protein
MKRAGAATVAREEQRWNCCVFGMVVIVLKII